MKFRRFSAAVLAAVMMTAAVPFTASAEETAKTHIVVLGDCISAGSGLAEGEQSYAELLADYMNARITCFAQESYMTDDVLACLDQADVQTALADADMILVSAGINDVLTSYKTLAYEYLEEFQLESFRDLFYTKHGWMGVSLADVMMRATYLSAATTENKNTAISNIKAIGKKLSQYPDAEVIYVNVYNAMDKIEEFDELNENRQLAYNTAAVYPINGVLNDPYTINPTIDSVAETYGFTVVDAYTLFEGDAYKYADPANIDYNLNADGQALLAVETAKTAGILMYGDLDGDKDVSAADSSALLEHAAEIGSGNPAGTLNAVQLAAADVNNDTEVDASDAAAILVYAAMVGAGVTPSFDGELNAN